MKEINLTTKEKANLEQRHKSCKNGKERDRIRAVLLYSEGWKVGRLEGWKVSMIAQALRIHETSVNRHDVEAI